MVCDVVFGIVLDGCGLYGVVMGTMWCVYSMYIVYMCVLYR